jgi:hypothetical protein
MDSLKRVALFGRRQPTVRFGPATQTVLVYRGLAAMAQSKQSLDIGYLTDSVNTYCQTIYRSVMLDLASIMASATPVANIPGGRA